MVGDWYIYDDGNWTGEDRVGEVIEVDGNRITLRTQYGQDVSVNKWMLLDRVRKELFGSLREANTFMQTIDSMADSLGHYDRMLKQIIIK